MNDEQETSIQQYFEHMDELRERIAALEAENARLDAWNGDMGHELRRQIAAVEAENAALRRKLAEAWQPIDKVELFPTAMLVAGGNQIRTYDVDGENERITKLPDGYAFCRRQEPKP